MAAEELRIPVPRRWWTVGEHLRRAALAAVGFWVLWALVGVSHWGMLVLGLVVSLVGTVGAERYALRFVADGAPTLLLVSATEVRALAGDALVRRVPVAPPVAVSARGRVLVVASAGREYEVELSAGDVHVARLAARVSEYYAS